jgi:hypothetical protein
MPIKRLAGLEEKEVYGVVSLNLNALPDWHEIASKEQLLNRIFTKGINFWAGGSRPGS